MSLLDYWPSTCDFGLSTSGEKVPDDGVNFRRDSLRIRPCVDDLNLLGVTGRQLEKTLPDLLVKSLCFVVQPILLPFRSPAPCQAEGDR